MDGASSQVTGLAVESRPCQDSEPAGLSATPPPRSPAQVYLDIARASLPRWLRIVGPAPWLADGSLRMGSLRRSTMQLYREQAVTLAIAMLCELDRRRRDRAYLREVGRASLVRWQSVLRCDGIPLRRKLRRSPLHAATLRSIVQVLGETAGFQTGLLLGDVERQLRWLSRRVAPASWLEAATICAMADGAVLVRDASLLTRARARLARLLVQQKEEGWFPEQGGADVGRLSLTVDALARVYYQSGWEELTGPLRRALRFLLHFVHPDGSAGGCHGSCGPGILTPYGVELLAPVYPEAAALALVVRRQCQDLDRLCTERWSDDLFAAWSASLAMAATHPAPGLPEHATYPCDAPGRWRFPDAGLSVFATPVYHAVVAGKKGGGLHVTWRGGAADLDDPGVTVVYLHGVRTSSRFDRSAVEQVTDSAVTSGGVLRRAGRASDRRWRSLKRVVGRLFRRRSTVSSPPSSKEDQPFRMDYRKLTHDRYERHITFGDDWIRIRDRVHCRLPCKTIICQSPSPVVTGALFDANSGMANTRPPIFVDGGRSVEITRVYRNGELVDQLPETP